MARAAGYLEFDPAQDRFSLPAEHVPTLASEPGPAFVGGVHHELIGAIQRYDQVATAFRDGGGVAPADLHPDVWAGTSRFTAQWHQNMLVQQWLPLVPDTQAKLLNGARVADVGCGSGQALIALARAFPAVTGVGYDPYQPVIEQARLAGPRRRRTGHARAARVKPAPAGRKGRIRAHPPRRAGQPVQ